MSGFEFIPFAVSPATPGFIYAFAGSEVPDGYLLCDGSE